MFNVYWKLRGTTTCRVIAYNSNRVIERRDARNYVIIIEERWVPVTLVSFNRTPMGMYS